MGRHWAILAGLTETIEYLFQSSFFAYFSSQIAVAAAGQADTFIPLWALFFYAIVTPIQLAGGTHLWVRTGRSYEQTPIVSSALSASAPPAPLSSTEGSHGLGGPDHDDPGHVLAGLLLQRAHEHAPLGGLKGPLLRGRIHPGRSSLLLGPPRRDLVSIPYLRPDPSDCTPAFLTS